ncbi:MAG: methionyl-tRNA formyltransferase [Deltaproteobacteria bacterium]|nr:methionyl-tRNA formyltransferase [Deltaproteobacteria bacterium]
MSLVFMGTPDLAVVILKALVDGGYPVCAVVCQPDKPRGRECRPLPPAVKEFASGEGLSICQPKRLRGAFAEQLSALQPELCVVAAYGRLLPPELLALPRRGCINVHASLLPAYRGAAPIQWAIANGERETGVSLMQMDAGLDTGPVLARTVVPIGPEETADILHDRLARAGADLLMRHLPDLLAGRLDAVAQDHERATLAPILRKEDALVDWALPAAVLSNRARGFHPWPGTETKLLGRRLKLFPPLAVVPHEGAEVPGTVLAASPSEGLLVRCGEGAVAIGSLQLEGRKRLPTAQFLQGARLGVGQKLG